MSDEAPLERTEHGVVPADEGWFVLNARDAVWWQRPGRGMLCEFESHDDRASFAHLGFNVTVLEPGQPMAMYHHEADEEDFLVVSGDATLVVEGAERTLRAWDFVHCPPGTAHVIVGTAPAGCVVVAVGARDRSTGAAWGAYTVDRAAIRHGAGVEQETTEPRVAYARFGPSRETSYRGGLRDL